MYEMCISCSMTCASRAARHVHVGMSQMCMSYNASCKGNEYIPVTKESFSYFFQKYTPDSTTHI